MTLIGNAMSPEARVATRVNDVHSRLNETCVGEVVHVDSLEAIQDSLARARASGAPVAIAGGRHAMGGQQFCAGGLLLDTTRLSRVLSLDPDFRTIEVEAGIQWPALTRALRRSPVTYAQKQTGADELSIGGAVSANVHGRGLSMRSVRRRRGELRPRAARRRGCHVQPGAERRALLARRRRLRALRRRVLGEAEARPARSARARGRARDDRGAAVPLRRADRRRLPVRRLPVRDRPGVGRLPAARRLLVLPAGRRSANHTGRAASAHGGGLAPPAASRTHRQVARLRGLRRALPRHLGPDLRVGCPPARLTTPAATTRRSGRGAR